MSAESIVLWQAVTTVASVADAERLARELVQTRLAACIQIEPQVRSFYRWKEQVEEATECRLTIKTIESAWPTLKQRILDLHPYEVPELLASPVADAHQAYARWAAEQVEVVEEA